MPATLAGTGEGYVTEAVGSSGTSLTVDTPANLVDQQLLVCTVYTRNTGATFTPPVGWTQAAYNGLNCGLAVFVRYVADASSEPASHTFTASTSSRWCVQAFLLDGVDSSDPVGPGAAGASNSGILGLVAPSVTTEDDDGLLICAWQGHHGSVEPDIEPPGGMANVADSTTTGGLSVIVTGAEELGAAGATGTRTATASGGSPATSNSSSLTVEIRAGVFVPPDPQVYSAAVGAPTAVGFRVTGHTVDASSVKLATSTSADMMSPATGSSASPDGNGYVTVNSASLAADTSYYWQLECDGQLVGPIGRARTAPTGNGSFSFAAASCARTNSNMPVFNAIRNRVGSTGQRALFFMHLGDFHYADLADSEEESLEANYALYQGVFAQSNQAALYREVPLLYTPSDHDFGGSNADGSNPNGPYFQEVYRAVIPHFDLVPDTNDDGEGIYHSFGVGRVKFIVTDGRSYMSSPLDEDGPSKTKLGATQLAWLKNELLDEDYEVFVIFGDSGWNNVTTWEPEEEENSYADDTWSGYATERQDIGSFIQDNNVNAWYVHGDFHAVAAESGANNTWGQFPIACCSPLDQTTYAGNGTWSEGYYPNPVSDSTYSQQYGWFDVVDTGDAITVAYTGYDQDGAARVTLSKTYELGTSTPFEGWGIPM